MIRMEMVDEVRDGWREGLYWRDDDDDDDGYVIVL